MSLYVWSDLHLDYSGNMMLIKNLDDGYKQHDIIVAGDLSDRLPVLAQAFDALASKFKNVFYVPGNHELWLRKEEINAGLYQNSIEKFHHILQLAARYGIQTQAQQNAEYIIAPVFSWYSLEEDGADSLTAIKQGEDASSSMWMDLHRCQWPAHISHKCRYFLSQSNRQAVLAHKALNPGKPVISFSHFLPTQALIFPDLKTRSYIPRYPQDPHPQFNFTRVAGSRLIEEYLEQIGSDIHVYGHQHRNKQAQLTSANSHKGRLYISHCLGYPAEPEITPTGSRLEPLKIWPPETSRQHDKLD